MRTSTGDLRQIERHQGGITTLRVAFWKRWSITASVDSFPERACRKSVIEKCHSERQTSSRPSRPTRARAGGPSKGRSRGRGATHVCPAPATQRLRKLESARILDQLAGVERGREGRQLAFFATHLKNFNIKYSFLAP